MVKFFLSSFLVLLLYLTIIWPLFFGVVSAQLDNTPTPSPTSSPSPSPVCSPVLFVGVRESDTGDPFGTNKTRVVNRPVQVGAFRDGGLQGLDRSLAVHITGPGTDEFITSGNNFTPNQTGDYTFIAGNCPNNSAHLKVITSNGIQINTPCSVTFSINGLDVIATNITIPPAPYQINQYFFDFGDGSGQFFSTTPQATHHYVNTGTFTITTFAKDTQNNQWGSCSTPAFRITGVNNLGAVPTVTPTPAASGNITITTVTTTTKTTTASAGTKELPKTGLPGAAWFLTGLIPVGIGLKRFRKIIPDGNIARFLWEKRQFFKS